MPVFKEASSLIREAKPEDAEALVALQSTIYKEGSWFVGDGPPSAEVLARKLRGLDPVMELYLVAGSPLEGTQLYGWLEINRFFIRKMEHVAMLTLAVAKDKRRQGLGRGLLECSYDWAKRVGVEKIQLNVRASNGAAIALYEQQGFGIEGRERRQILDAGRYEDNVMMAKFFTGTRQ
jgi:ribosomal protein S18 acetylase RimI-like enzyme